MHPITAYLERHEMRSKALAERLGIHPGTLSNIISGKRGPGRVVAMRISEATGGEVTANDLFAALPTQPAE